MEQVKLLSMTVVLAVLVWAAADSLVNEAVSIGITFEMTPSAATPPSMIKVIEPEGGSFELEISGPRRIVEDVQSQAPLRARLRIPDRPTGSAVVPLNKESLKSELAEQFNEFGRLTVVAVHPPTLAIRVDHLVSKEVEIRLERLTLPYEVPPQLKRASTTVRMRFENEACTPGGAIGQGLAPLRNTAHCACTGRPWRNDLHGMPRG